MKGDCTEQLDKCLKDSHQKLNCIDFLQTAPQHMEGTCDYLKSWNTLWKWIQAKSQLFLDFRGKEQVM